MLKQLIALVHGIYTETATPPPAAPSTPPAPQPRKGTQAYEIRMATEAERARRGIRQAEQAQVKQLSEAKKEEQVSEAKQRMIDLCTERLSQPRLPEDIRTKLRAYALHSPDKLKFNAASIIFDVLGGDGAYKGNAPHLRWHDHMREREVLLLACELFAPIFQSEDFRMIVEDYETPEIGDSESGSGSPTTYRYMQPRVGLFIYW